ncbi:hypothetical protein GCM10027276_04220 [Comamonas piscis]
MNGFSDTHHARLASAHQAATDRQDARANWLEQTWATNSPFLPRFNGVVQEAFGNFDPTTLAKLCGQLQAGNDAAAGEILRNYLLEVCEDGVDEVLDQEAAEVW